MQGNEEFPLGMLLSLLTVGTFILTAPEGLLYYMAGFYLYTPWKNIAAVESIATGVRQMDHLHLRFEELEGKSLEEGIKEQMAAAASGSVLQILNAISPSGRSSSFIRRYIPVGFFGSHWKEGELWSDVTRYRKEVNQQ